MKMHKTGGTACGTCGTIEWSVKGGQDNQKLSVIAMGSVPYNRNHYSNWLAVGVCASGYNTSATFSVMYHESKDFSARKQFYSCVEPVEYGGQMVRISAVMGTTHKADIIIDVDAVDPLNHATVG